MSKMQGKMDVQGVVESAKEYITKLFADEDIRSTRLEEIVFDEGKHAWKVTISFLRPSLLSPLTDQRTFKVVQIDDRTNYVVSVTHRGLPGSD